MIIDFPLGSLSLRYSDGSLLAVDILERSRADKPGDLVAIQLKQAFDGYFSDPHHDFGIRVRATGTEFQQRVWRLLRHIPVGKTKSYGELAGLLGSSARAIGNACRANPCPIIIPCHRVVAKNGLGGYGGETQGSRLELKRWLLRHEGVRID